MEGDTDKKPYRLPYSGYAAQPATKYDHSTFAYIFSSINQNVPHRTVIREYILRVFSKVHKVKVDQIDTNVST